MKEKNQALKFNSRNTFEKKIEKRTLANKYSHKLNYSKKTYIHCTEDCDK